MKLSWLAVLLLVLVNVHTAASASCRKSLSRCTQHSDCCNNRRCMIWKRCSLFLQRPNNDATVIYKCFETREELNEGIRLFRSDNSTEMTQVKQMYGSRMGNWCVDRMTDFDSLFSNTSGVAQGFNEDISKWNTSSVTNMRRVFANQQQFNQDISRWDVSKVSVMTAMFFDAKQFNQDISSWDVSMITGYRGGMRSVFQGASSFNQSLCPWKDHISTNIDMYDMFTGTSCINTDHPYDDGDLLNSLCHPCNN
jgi:surface protein